MKVIPINKNKINLKVENVLDNRKMVFLFPKEIVFYFPTFPLTKIKKF